MSPTSLLTRLSVVALAAATLSGVAIAQEEPFQVQTPFGGGETWRLRSELTTTAQPVGVEGAAEDEAEVRTITWTESAEVLVRPLGFALRDTLTSWRMDARSPNAESRVTYDDEDLQTIRVGPDCEVPFARTWVVEFDPSWRQLDVAGLEETLDQLYARALVDMTDEDDGCGENMVQWLARRARPFVVSRWSERLEQRLIQMNDEGLAPVRVVMERLRGGGTIEPGFEAKVAPAGELPAGTVRYVGRGDQGAEFRVSFDAQSDLPAPEYAFEIDDAGRLVRLDVSGTRVVTKDGRPTRVTTQFAYALEEVTPSTDQPAATEESPDEPGMDTRGREPAPREERQPY